MESVIIKPKNEVLKQYVQYFLFFKKTNFNTVKYTTFPNNNLCLAVYKQSKITYLSDPKTNNCIVSNGNKSFVSKLYGFHKMPFQVDINSFLDQMCIVFYPSSLRAFTFEKYEDMLKSDSVFEELFVTRNRFLLEEIFDYKDFTKRAEELESLLLKNLKTNNIPFKLKEALSFIAKNGNCESLNIETISKNLEISDSSLFRLFKNHLGENPKSYLKTIRFRKALAEIINQKSSFTKAAYLSQYYDQAHFINDFKKSSGFSPKNLVKNVSLEQNDLAWIYKEY